jgi:hypothetical protein
MGRPDLDLFKTPIYTVEGTAFVSRNGDRYSNRPLYCNQVSGVVLGGDRPYAMFGGGSTRGGVFIVGLLRDGKITWMQLASNIRMEFIADQVTWWATDTSWGKTSLTLSLVPAPDGIGMELMLDVSDPLPGDKIVWLSGGAMHETETFLNKYDLTTGGRESKLTRGFTPDDCTGNQVTIENQSWTVRAPKAKGDTAAIGRFSEPATLSVVDAGDWQDAVKLLAGSVKNLPICCGVYEIKKPDNLLYWSIRENTNGMTPNPQADFEAGLKRVQTIREQVVMNTPDPWLNATVGASCGVMDGVYRDGVYTHAGMRWGVPLLGWRTTFGATAYGWHDRVMTMATKAIAKQITESDKTQALADPATLLSSQAPSSRLFGKGRIDFHQPYHYDMQSQFFDQLLYAWRSTGDPALEKLLKPSLDLHLEYLKDCFDPQGLGIYESYANTWPTDAQWYNGGGTSEETAYAYRGHHDAMLIAQRAGDAEKVKFHQAAMDRIRKGFFDLLWEKEHGHPGAYREQGGLKRLHDSAWLYAIFCPIDAGLLDQQQAAQALDYTEWGLERMKMPYGGEQCWPSNWVPSIWSLREMWPGDNYHLALAYYQTGLADQGWSLLKGTFPQQAIFGPVPGDLGHPAGGTDFNDCASMFCRTVVEGLFGYSPDYPDGKVTISPAFPAEWNYASIATPDFSLQFARVANQQSYQIKIAHAANLELRLPVSTTSVSKVLLDGKPVPFGLMPSFGKSYVRLALTNATSANVEVYTANSLGTFDAIRVNANTGDVITLKADKSVIREFSDPQGALSGASIVDGAIAGTVTANTGNHLIFGLTEVGSTSQWRLFKLHTTDVAAEKAASDKLVMEVPKDATWATVDMKPVFNGDIRTIYQQKYLSPRPNTASLRLASDGYSTWQMVLDKKNQLPKIDLSGVASLTNAQQQIVSREGAVFALSKDDKNIAFTSQWDNWPKQVEVPVHQAGDAMWFLVCGSTNPMEVRIANASIDIVYVDGGKETLELIPPMNFWTLCPLQKADYDYRKDFFALPNQPPSQLQLGENCRAIVLNRRLRPGVKVDHVTLNALSQQSVIGLMAVTVMNATR